jgi:hypothetical protein
LAAGVAFFVAAPPVPLEVLITVILADAFLAAAATGFLTIVVPVLASLESLIARPLPTLGGTTGAAALFPRPASSVLALCSVTLRVAAPLRVDFAFSTMFVSMLAVPPYGSGAAGLRGEMGRLRWDFPGDTARVRELADRGERTWEDMILEVVRVGSTGSTGETRSRLGFLMSSFSLPLEEMAPLSLSAGSWETRLGCLFTLSVSCHVGETASEVLGFLLSEPVPWMVTETWAWKVVLLVGRPLKHSGCISRAIPPYLPFVMPLECG